jgi:hypothetical protein
MTDLAPLPVKGYKAQSENNVALVNTNKELEEHSLRILDLLGGMESVDKRWLAIGRTHLEQAWMAINRSIFKPGRIGLPGDATQEG